jgi:hypothetical protein
MCDGDKYALHIIPFHGDTTKFYVFQFQSLAHSLAAAEMGLHVRCPNGIGRAKRCQKD